jgi:ATP-dependent Clp protease protease subunit
MNGIKKMQNNFPMDDFIGAQEKVELKFLENHTHFLTGDIEEENIKKAIQWIVYENMSTVKDKRLTLYINSYGGDLYQAFGLIDMMNKSKYPIITIGIGSIMSAGFLIFAAGTKGHRYIAENTGIMCHQFTDAMEGKYHDIKSAAREHEFNNQRMLSILRSASGLSDRIIKSKLLGPTDLWLSPEELIELNIADHIL